MISSEIKELQIEKRTLEKDLAQKEADGKLKNEKEELKTILKQLEIQKEETQKRLNDLDKQEFEVLKNKLMDSTVMQQALRSKMEEELNILKKKLQEETFAHQKQIGDLQQKHAMVVEKLNEQLDSVQKAKSALDKIKSNLESENDSMTSELQSLSSAHEESERCRKQMENQLQELAIKYEEVERNKNDMSEKAKKLQEQLSEETKQKLAVQKLCSSLYKAYRRTSNDPRSETPTLTPQQRKSPTLDASIPISNISNHHRNETTDSAAVQRPVGKGSAEQRAGSNQSRRQVPQGHIQNRSPQRGSSKFSTSAAPDNAAEKQSPVENFKSPKASVKVPVQNTSSVGSSEKTN